MKEEQLNTLREQDKNLRDAIRMEEAEMPQMPADLNARLMQRMAQEPRKARTRTIWPWIAAACVAGVMMIWLTPPKEQMPTVAMQTPSQQTPSPTLPLNGKEEVSAEVSKVEEPVVAKVEKKEVPQRTPRAKKVQDAQKTLTPQAADVCNDLAAVQEQEESTPLPSGEGQKGEAVVTLTEHDIPITRPENYKYTPEELALMRKQANEAYLKWVQLELEISKYNLEQTAQK
ncbi:hypothetical protein [uncultured Prevotella sp.]|uniref:hypothetical protein n=1 Tax=uncultured Prevotella sp. TaxID=159272 RepID=UPI0025E87B7E|nr:hypothetical protein [uncultured Prevotella sp.]